MQPDQNRELLMWKSGIPLALFLLGVLTSIGSHAVASDEIRYRDQTIHLNSLQDELRSKSPPSDSEEAQRAFIHAQPKLVLDNALLYADSAEIGPLQTLSVSRLDLIHGSRIVMNGTNLELTAEEIHVDSSSAIVSFQDEALLQAAPPGTDGRTGLNAGTLVLRGKIVGNDPLRISLKGQDGQAGGSGFPGPQGAPGTNGDNAADHLFDCAHGGGNGGNGGRGGPGGQGGRGGNGGNGGRLVLRGEIAGQRLQVQFESPGGHPGSGGMGGRGGAGGQPGRGGSGSHYCRGGQVGSQGPSGEDGPAGAPGAPGREGYITSD
jgi:hypothetical protein